MQFGLQTRNFSAFFKNLSSIQTQAQLISKPSFEYLLTKSIFFLIELNNTIFITESVKILQI